MSVVGGMNRLSGFALDNDGARAPACLVTVYESGTLTPVTLYEDGQGATPLANPFTSDASAFWFFYCTSQRVDIQFSGGTIVTPYTLGDQMPLPVVPSAAYADLPAVTPTGAGSLVQVLDTFPGLWDQSADGWYMPGGIILDAEAFGMVGDGATDNTAQFNAMIAVAGTAASKSVTCRFGPGLFRFATQPNAIPTGILLLGNGSAGSTNNYGTQLQRDYAPLSATEPFIKFDGSGPVAAGSGGGLREIGVYTSSAHSGGYAVLLTGTDDNHRAGFFIFDRCVISATGGSTWNKGFVVDGTGLATAGTKGVREVRFTHTQVASCSDADSNIYLLNSVHFYVFGSHLVPGNSAACGMTVSGANANEPSTNIFVAASNIDGGLVLDFCQDVIFSGRIGGNFSCTANSFNVTLLGALHGTYTNTGSTSVAIYTGDFMGLADATIKPLLTAGMFVQPITANAGANLLRARSLTGATGNPDGWHCTPATGGSGQPYRGYNQQQNAGDNNATYFRTAYPVFRTGNPLGDGTYAYNIYVAAAGIAGNAITYIRALAVSDVGVVEQRVGAKIGTTSAFNFTVLTGTTNTGLGLFADGQTKVTNQTVTGAALGDTCLASHDQLTQNGWQISAMVTSANNVRVTISNFTGGPLTPGVGLLRVDVIHHL